MHGILRSTLLLGLSAAAVAARAELAQEPLLNRPRHVPPNLMILMDNSASMSLDRVYEYGDATTSGPKGPIGGGTLPNWSPLLSSAPDINKIAYDPRVRYDERVDAAGQPVAPPAWSVVPSQWSVYYSRIGSGPYSTGDTRWDDYQSYHRPAYLPNAAEVVPGSTQSYPNVVDSAALPAGTLFPKFRGRTDCVALPTSCTLAEERTNYTNWFRWHKTRLNIMKTGLLRALSELPNDTVRIGLATYEDVQGGPFTTATPRISRGVSSLDGTTRGALSGLVNDMSGTVSTPTLSSLHRVGRYFERSDSDGPWATVPNPASLELANVAATGPGASELPAQHAACRRSYVMVFTDGYWNDPVSSLVPRPTVGNVDGTPFSVPRERGGPFTYQPSAPFADTHSDTLADIAMHFWSRDLRPDLPNRVPTVNRPWNPSTWQNLTLYGLSFGVSGLLPQNAATMAELNSGVRQWPLPARDTPTTVDDLWHATVNAKGEHIQVQNSTEVRDAFRRILSNVSGTPQTLSGVAVSSAYLRSGTRKYKPQYIPGEWSGLLSAIELDARTGNEASPPLVHWQVESGSTPNGDPITTIPAAALRNIVTWDGTRGVAFTSAETGLDANLVAYLRGDASLEMRNGGTYRNRSARLGDIVNSNPVFIKEGVDLAYEKLVGSFGNYRAFVSAKAARTEGVVFVGANDGMLHGFRDSNGAEVFAFVPKSLYGKLPRLADDPYVHRYFVDGPLVETDGYLGGAWKSVLLGTTGAGGKSVFAMDVTRPLAMTENSVLWEVNSATPGFANLGSVSADVQAGVTPSGHWVAVFGNGQDSSTGVASLFVVSLENGSLLREIVVPGADGNGLGGVRAVYDSNRRLLGVYGGDLKGRLWRFDLTGGGPGAWQLGLSGQPLFDAGTERPITATPAVVAHPVTGRMVVFGSGRLLEAGDVNPPYAMQRTHGVWDPTAFGNGSGRTAPLSSLVQQTLTPVQVGVPPVTYYQLSSNAVGFGDGQDGVRGWYMDLDSGTGQRVIYPIDRISEGFVLVSTMSPVSANAPDACTPSGAGQGWVYLVNALTGSGPERAAFDTNMDGVVSPADLIVAGYTDGVDGRPTSIDRGSTNPVDRLCIESADESCRQIELTCGQAGARECPSATGNGLKSRQWRQIFLR